MDQFPFHACTILYHLRMILVAHILPCPKVGCRKKLTIYFHVFTCCVCCALNANAVFHTEIPPRLRRYKSTRRDASQYSLPFNFKFKYLALVADRVYASNGLHFGLNSKENRHNSVFAMQGQSVTIQQHRIYWERLLRISCWAKSTGQCFNHNLWSHIL